MAKPIPVQELINNFGDLKLENVTLFDNVSGNGTMIENKGGTLTLSELVQVKKGLSD
jgi:hypothetical protein